MCLCLVAVFFCLCVRLVAVFVYVQEYDFLCKCIFYGMYVYGSVCIRICMQLGFCYLIAKYITNYSVADCNLEIYNLLNTSRLFTSISYIIGVMQYLHYYYYYYFFYDHCLNIYIFYVFVCSHFKEHYIVA